MWATKECEQQGLTADGLVKREILGEEVITAIRFPTMKLEEFSSVVLDSDILTKEEIKNVVKRLGSLLTPTNIFIEKKRCGVSSDIKQCCRLGSLSSRDNWSYGGSRTDCIDFSVDEDIALRGLCFFGGWLQCHSVRVKLIETHSKIALASVVGEFPSKRDKVPTFQLLWI